METAKYITYLLRKTGSQSTPAEMLDDVNIAQNEIFSINTYFNMKKPAAACFLNTTAGILQYTIADTQIRQISRVFTSSREAAGDEGYFGINYAANNFIPVQSEESLSPDENVIITFAQDPGDTTEQYFYDAFLWPMNGQLTTDTVPLSVPESVQTGYLRYLVTKSLEETKDGRSIYNDEQSQREEKEFITFANQGARLRKTVPNMPGV